MQIKKLIFIFFIFFSNSGLVKEYVIGFGSCIDQDLPQPIWQAIEAKNVDTFMFLGDNVYGDHPSGKLDKLKKDPEYKKKIEQLKQDIDGGDNKKPAATVDNQDVNVDQITNEVGKVSIANEEQLKKVMKDGLLKELKRRQYYEKPSLKRQRKLKESMKRVNKLRRLQERLDDN